MSALLNPSHMVLHTRRQNTKVNLLEGGLAVPVELAAGDEGGGPAEVDVFT